LSYSRKSGRKRICSVLSKRQANPCGDVGLRRSRRCFQGQQ